MLDTTKVKNTPVKLYLESLVDMDALVLFFPREDIMVGYIFIYVLNAL